MLYALVLFLLLVMPGFIALWVFETASCLKIKSCCKWVIAALVFDLPILAINFAVIYIFNGICKLDKLMCYFQYLKSICKYSLLSVFTGIVLAILAALLFRLCFKLKGHDHKGGCK